MVSVSCGRAGVCTQGHGVGQVVCGLLQCVIRKLDQSCSILTVSV